MNLVDSSGTRWSFKGEQTSSHYSDVITIRMGDFNLDGYPDFLVTLYSEDKARVTLVENVPCEEKTCSYSRKFEPRWNLFEDFGNTVLGTFSVFDDFKDSVALDVLLVQKEPDGKHQVRVYRDETEKKAFYLKVGQISCGFCYIILLYQVLVGSFSIKLHM